MIRARQRTTALCLLALAGTLALAVAAPARADLLLPAKGKVFFGASDTGDSAQFGEFTKAIGKHPAVIESFRTWGSDFPESIVRWQRARARPILHISTADPSDGHELINPRAIAQGYGDDYLMRLNRLFWAKKMRAYIRPLGEPNRCLNVYAAYDCGGNPRGGEHSPYWYKQAFRRIYVLLHGGGKVAAIDARLAEAAPAAAAQRKRQPPRRPAGGSDRGRLEPAAIRLADRAPATCRNTSTRAPPTPTGPAPTSTPSYPEWGALTHLYDRYPRKPFVLTEWSVQNSDDPAFVQRLFVWLHRHPRCRMLVYYQDFGSSNSYRIENFPASLGVLRHQLASPTFPSFAPGAPQLPPPPPGGLAP